MRAWISWSIWASLMLILFLIPAWFAWSAVSALPHARALVRAYAASPDCEPSDLLRAAAPQLPQRAPSAAPAGTLCEVQPMTLQDAWRSQLHGDDYYIDLTDEAGTQFAALIHDSYFWHGLKPQAKVNVQLVEGKITMITDGTKVARTDHYPDNALQSLRLRLIFSAPFSIPFLILLGFSIKGWQKKSRRRSSGDIAPSEKEGRDPLGAASPALECPNFQGQPLAQARQELEAAGYKVGRISFIPSPSSDVGTILAQTPPPGSKVAPGTAFEFQVSIEAKTQPSNS